MLTIWVSVSTNRRKWLTTGLFPRVSFFCFFAEISFHDKSIILTLIHKINNDDHANDFDFRLPLIYS